MKKNLLFIIAAAALLFIGALLINDGWIYSAAALCAVSIVSVIRYFHSNTMKLTRWAKENPRKAQLLITILQVSIIFLGLLIGYDLKELGYTISFIPSIVFGVLLTVGFLSVRFLPKRKLISLPSIVNRDRMAYMSVALSAFVLMVSTGNRIENKFPNSPLTSAIRSIDQAMFSENNFSDQDDMLSGLSAGNQTKATNDKSSLLAFASISVIEVKSGSTTIHPNDDPPSKIKEAKKASKFEKKKKKIMKKIEMLRKAFAGGASVGVVLLIILLVLTTCAGICIAILGTTAGAAIAGIAIAGLSIYGIVKLATRKKIKNSKES